MLLALIGKRRLDITEVALAEVTDEFIAYVTALRTSVADGAAEADDQAGGARLRAESSANLAELSRFLLVAATLLDLKCARLLPRGEVDDELDLELLEARDLLFARLLQYRAYKGVSTVLAAAMSSAQQRSPRDVGLEEPFRHVLPPLDFTATPNTLAALFAAVISRDRTPPTVGLDHLHLPQVSVAEQRTHVIGMLQESDGPVEFSQLVAGAESGLVVVARFLALLELFKAGICALDQPQPLGDLHVALTSAAVAGAEVDAAVVEGDFDA